MKLRSPLRLQQLLFILIAAALLLGSPGVRAQQDASVTFKANPQQPISMKVLGVEGSSLMVKEQYGAKGYPLAQIANVSMTEPPEVQAALKAFQAKDYPKAMAAVRSVLEKYKGLPANWAITMAALVGNIYLDQNDLPKASAAYEDFAKAYPGNGGADMGRARVAVAKKDYDTARKLVEARCEAALKEPKPNPVDGQVDGQAFLVLGQVKEAAGDYPGALKDYLRTVTLFYYDRAATASAQEKADALRKAHAVFVP